MDHQPSVWIRVSNEIDVTRSIVETETIAKKIGFELNICKIIATSTSELARNILKYAGTGEIIITSVQKGYQAGIEITAQDRGAGIADIERAMSDNFSSGGTLGLGLPGVKRMMDELEIDSTSEQGTRIVVRKWC